MEYGDFMPEHQSHNFTDDSAIDFANKYFAGWRVVRNHGLNGLDVVLKNRKELSLSFNQVEEIKSLKN